MRQLILGVATLAAMAAIGCSVATDGTEGEGADGVSFTNSETGEAITPFETLSFEGGVRVGFFEPAPGDLSVTAWGPNGAATPLTKELANEKLSPVELFERLGERSAPETLVQAQARATALAKEVEKGDSPDKPVLSEDHAPISSEEPAGFGPVRSKEQKQYLFDCKGTFSYDEWFNCTFCWDGGDYDVTWMWSTGDGSFTREDMIHAYTTVSVWGGGGLNLKTEKRPWYSWSTVKTTNIANGFWVTQETPFNTTDYDTRSTVSQASGDSYHWCGYGW